MNREFLPKDLKIETWDSIAPYSNNLKDRKIESADDLKTWLKNKSELDAVLEEDLAWRYIKMNCNTEDDALSAHFEKFITEIEPKITEVNFELNKLLNDNPFKKNLEGKAYEIMLRSVKSEIELYRKENIPIQAEIQKEEQEYGKIAAAMTINYKGEEITLQKAANYLKETDRKTREEVYKLIWERRLNDKKALNELLEKLTIKRQQLARNAGFENFRDYMFKKLGRFDYNVEDCYQFHESVKTEVVPLIEKIHKTRKEKLGFELLKPWDLDVDEDLKPPLKPFEKAEELIEKTLKCFNSVKPQYAEFISIMQKGKFLDLDSRKGKAPGGFNYPLHESNIPFIFMNATGNLRDVETMVHEGGHAIHSFLTKDLELVDFKETPSEVAELASMSMELISMEHWDAFFKDKEELRRAKRSQLLGTIEVLPWVAMVDKFQHLIYIEKSGSVEKYQEIWKKTAKEFSDNTVDWNGLDDFFNNQWQKQLHIYEVPFYYIEYGFAQLGAIAVWRNYKLNPEKGLTDYENALKLGYTKSIPEIYKAAGIEFNFSKNT
ncbi:MAG: M3 family oligoendopeptidase, partial [Chloroflexia bacterium]|nr:M3 family oligoendopeptidase [Chloroflexia bacterium]